MRKNTFWGVLALVLMAFTTTTFAREHSGSCYSEIYMLAKEDGGLKACPTQQKTNEAIFKEVSVLVNEKQTAVSWGFLNLKVGDRNVDATWVLIPADKIPGTWFVFFNGQRIFRPSPRQRVITGNARMGDGEVVYTPTSTTKEEEYPNALLLANDFIDPVFLDFRFVASNNDSVDAVTLEGSKCSDVDCVFDKFAIAFMNRLQIWAKKQGVSAEVHSSVCGKAVYKLFDKRTSQK